VELKVSQISHNQLEASQQKTLLRHGIKGNMSNTTQSMTKEQYK
jgi:hypothetical protein